MTTQPDDMRTRTWMTALLWLTILLYFFTNFQRVCVPGPIFNELQSSLKASASQIAAIGSCFLYAYAFGQLLNGILLDKFGEHRVVMGGAIAFTIGSFLFPCANSLPLLYAARIITSLGGGCFYLALVESIRKLYPSSYTSVLGIVIFLGYLGGTTGTSSLPLLVQNAGIPWRTTLLAAAIIIGILTILYAICKSKVPKQPIRPGRLSLVPYKNVCKTKGNLLVMAAWCSTYGLYFTIPAIFGQKFLEDVAQSKPKHAAHCISSLFIISAVTNVVTGFLGQRFPNREKTFLMTTTALAFCGNLLILTGILLKLHQAHFMFCFAILAVTSGFSPVTNAYIQNINPSRQIGTAIGLSNFGSYFFVAIFGKLAGFLLDAFSDQAVITETATIYPPKAYLTIFGLFTLFNIVAFTFACLAPKTPLNKDKTTA